MALNTTVKDNPTYYGQAIGSANVSFSGEIDRPTIDVTAVTADGTNLVMPIEYQTNASESNFVEFVSRDDESGKPDTVSTALKGIALNLALSATEDAHIKIIFDEQAGDILQGYGRGNMNIKLLRTGELIVYGDYLISEGDYLFTLLDVVNKPFVVKEGGTIRWTGDPVNALIDLDAEYKGLYAPLTNLVAEYISEEQRQEAGRNTKVDLSMNLKGSLLAPKISFDISFPELTGELKSIVDNKMRAISSDPQELNQQVFGLVVFGGFMPLETGKGPQVANLGNSTINTLSELFSNHLSSIVSNLLNDLVEDVDFISGIDFDIAYSQTLGLKGNQVQTNSFQDGEYQFSFRNRLWDDRWVVTIGGNYSSQSFISNDPYFNPDAVIEWNTPWNGLKLRVYYRGEDSIQGQKQKVGGGIRYRKEFDSFLNFKKAFQERKSS